MKKLVLLVMIFLISTVLFAQDTSKIIISKKDLTTEQLQKYQQNTIPEISKWVGLGKEIGVAMNEGLVALTQNAVNFADTKLGTYTMIIIAWKVLGKDVLRLVFGIPMWLILMCIILRSYRKSCFYYKVLKEKKYVGKGWFFKRYDKSYETIKPSDNGIGINGVKGVHATIGLVSTGIFLLIIFV